MLLASISLLAWLAFPLAHFSPAFSLVSQAERGVSGLRELGEKGGEGAETALLGKEAEGLTKEKISARCGQPHGGFEPGLQDWSSPRLACLAFLALGLPLGLALLLQPALPCPEPDCVPLPVPASSRVSCCPFTSAHGGELERSPRAFPTPQLLKRGAPVSAQQLCTWTPNFLFLYPQPYDPSAV